MVWQTAQTLHEHQMEVQLMSRVVERGALGVPGAPAVRPVGQVS